MLCKDAAKAGVTFFRRRQDMKVLPVVIENLGNWDVMLSMSIRIKNENNKLNLRKIFFI